MAHKALTRAEENDIEQTVRQVLGEVLNEVSDELSAPTDEPPTGGRSARMSLRAGARAGGPNSPPTAPGNGAVPPEVEEAVETLLQDLSPEQAQTLASLFEAIGEHGDEENEEPEGFGEAPVEMGTMKAAKAQGEMLARGGRLQPIINALKRQGKRIFYAAVRAAKGGPGAFRRWVNGLSNFNPLKWAIKALPDAIEYQLITWLASQAEGAAAGRAATGRQRAMTDAYPDEIEQVVRRVLSQALTEPHEGLPAH